MPRYTLHYNPGCQECVRLARWNARLDWLRRFARIAEPSPNGMPELGDIHVVDNRTSVIYYLHQDKEWTEGNGLPMSNLH